MTATYYRLHHISLQEIRHTTIRQSNIKLAIDDAKQQHILSTHCNKFHEVGQRQFNRQNNTAHACSLIILVCSRQMHIFVHM